MERARYEHECAMAEEAAAYEGYSEGAAGAQTGEKE